jgi:mannan polymerase II complex ANP1 subunit
MLEARVWSKLTFVSIGVWMTHPNYGDFPYDLNSWIESDQGRALSIALAEDTIIVEGYPEFETNRTYLANLRRNGGDPMEQVELDAIGGVSILVKSEVFRTGCHFPAFSFQNQVETEAFGKVRFVLT